DCRRACRGRQRWQGRVHRLRRQHQSRQVGGDRRRGAVTEQNGDDLHAPVLPGPGASDYERYLRTDELLSLQKTAEERGHHDELLFQTVHQSSELWLKFAWTEVEEAAAALERE